MTPGGALCADIIIRHLAIPSSIGHSDFVMATTTLSQPIAQIRVRLALADSRPDVASKREHFL
jgi:hypothetical protein